ncbi:MAG TPA: hypothetical protein VGB55_01680 [Tepidisphaeraceae bacterium]|jgi:hypothetical protein
MPGTVDFRSRYADWKAPKAEADHLLWPSAGGVVSDAFANSRRLSEIESLRIQNTPLSGLRAEARSNLGVAADQLLIATGHQVEMYHPGVWVKNVLIDAVAQKAGGRAIHFAVDTDTPKHLQLRWPGGAVLMSDDAAIVDGAWSALVRRPSANHLNKIKTLFDQESTSWHFRPLLADHWHALDAKSDATDDSLVQSVLNLANSIDDNLGLRVGRDLLSKRIAETPFLAFAHHLAADAARVAEHYNRALADYRTAEGITTAARPMPDLMLKPQRVELPFWLDDLQTQERIRAVVIKTPDGWWLDAEEPFLFDPKRSAAAAAASLLKYLSEQNLRLAPRALTLTMYFRLLVVDQFIHGIGGGRYDQVTDRLIETYWGIAAPAFSVSTLTLRFPGANPPDSACVPCLMNQGHRLKHNLSGSQKQAHLAAIAAAPRNSMQRRAHFLAMHRALASAVDTTNAVPAWRAKLEQAIADDARYAVLRDRELFYGIQPRERLLAVIDQFAAAFA